MEEVNSGEAPLVDRQDYISMLFIDPGIYKLIFRLKATRVEAFADWVCSEVLPSLMKD